VVPLSEIYLYSDTSGIDWQTTIQDKDSAVVVEEIKALTSDAFKLSDLRMMANKIDESIPGFPVNGSTSGVNRVYEKILLSTEQDLNIIAQGSGELVEKKIAESLDSQIAKFDRDVILKEASVYKDIGETHKEVVGKRRIRIEDRKQKRRVAALENYTCQVCGFYCEYENNGQKSWIIEVDHIIEKSQGGGEELNNLWVLCPNCHKKKTRGIITIDSITKQVKELGLDLQISNNHWE